MHVLVLLSFRLLPAIVFLFAFLLSSWFCPGHRRTGTDRGSMGLLVGRQAVCWVVSARTSGAAVTVVVTLIVASDAFSAGTLELGNKKYNID